MSGRIYNFYHMEFAYGTWQASGRGSTFGGPNDPGDNGIGASGFPDKDYPHSAYVALPEAVCRAYGFPWYCRVTVEFQSRQIRGFLADFGPAGFTGRIVDMSPAIMQALGADTDDVFKIYVDPRYICGHEERIAPVPGGMVGG